MDLRRRLGPLLLPLALLAAGAGPAYASAGPRLLAPLPGSELPAGSLAVVEWEDPPQEAEEWEAFLSLDGGRSYPIRITPHLDAGIRRFSFQLPPFPTRDARVLLRFGDERREVEFETAQGFAITPRRTSLPLDLGIALSRGERPRPRDPGVVVWTEGARDGSGLRQVASSAAEDSSLRSVASSRPHWMPLFWPSRSRAGRTAPLVPSWAFQLPSSLLRAAELSGSPPLLPSVRLLTGRLNE
jgi:hypothetical protein